MTAVLSHSAWAGTAASVSSWSALKGCVCVGWVGGGGGGKRWLWEMSCRFTSVCNYLTALIQSYTVHLQCQPTLIRKANNVSWSLGEIFGQDLVWQSVVIGGSLQFTTNSCWFRNIAHQNNWHLDLDNNIDRQSRENMWAYHCPRARRLTIAQLWVCLAESLQEARQAFDMVIVWTRLQPQTLIVAKI